MKYTIAFDTICQGYQPVLEDGKPCEYETEELAQVGIDSGPEFYEDCFVISFREIGRKAIYTGAEK